MKNADGSFVSFIPLLSQYFKGVDYLFTLAGVRRFAMRTFTAKLLPSGIVVTLSKREPLYNDSLSA